jgi:hypothetical protein
MESLSCAPNHYYFCDLQYKENIIKAGFVECREQKYKMPVGDWSCDPKMKELERMEHVIFPAGYRGNVPISVKQSHGCEYFPGLWNYPMLMTRSDSMRRCKFILLKCDRSSLVVKFILIMRCEQWFFPASCVVVKLHRLTLSFLDTSCTVANQRREHIKCRS